jgi:hypothetical protein
MAEEENLAKESQAADGSRHGEQEGRTPDAGTPEGSAPEAASPEARVSEDGTARSGDEPQVVPLGAIGTRDLLVTLLGLLASKAWEGMGLIPNPATQKIQKDLAGARMAIDAYGAIFGVVRAEVEEQHCREIEALLTTLRINFVEKSSA